MKNLMLAMGFALLSQGALADSPNDVVQGAADELTREIGGRKQELAANREELHEVIDRILLPRFDRRYAAQLVLGRHWRTASAEQRDRFIDAFYRSLLRRYADGVLEFNQEQVEILPFRGDDDKARTTVKTIVRLDDGTRVPVDYALVNRDGNWLMFDVTLEGISYVRNFPTELNAEIQSTSLDAVIARLEGEAEADS